tara:strand:+ start:826 stop:1158 length:333 start_codon:yes stop_codon:yes gene_type:complete
MITWGKAKRIKELENQLERQKAHSLKLAEDVASYTFALHLFHDAFLVLYPAYSAEEVEEKAIVISDKFANIKPQTFKTFNNNMPWFEEYVIPRLKRAWKQYRKEFPFNNH